jgi:hypothetical protein
MRHARAGLLCGALLAAGACGDSRPAVERVEAFCAGIAKGEQIKVVLARYDQFGLQPGGTAPAPAQRIAGMPDAQAPATITSVLAEPVGSPDGPRPVCAVYYSSRLLGGDNAVILAEFKRDWASRY